ncbi:RING finger protein 17 isoform X2 [Octopus sinensis]|uniref:RING finger protein 17 isoform X2 n=1 Tax=Octopus sinensis TaxID=2607531 RepID=A0A6P7TLW6_9MOLL|nr:RING finger protein 17 isoform X2 [Octopus sinensis]
MQFLPNCPSCNDSYCIQGSSVNAHRPKLLCCGHTFCESCINKLTVKNKLKCPKCKQSTNFTKNKGSVKALPQDIYVSGLLALNQQTLFQREFHNPISYSREKAPVVEKNKTVFCFECHQVSADIECLQCDVAMCNQCFKKVHTNSVALKMHQSVPLGSETAAINQEVDKCLVHKNRILEYYCQDDEVNICSRCVIIGKHKGHNIIAIEKHNENLLDSLKESLPTASIVINKMKSSLKELSTLASKDKEHLVTVSIAIHEYFHFLHAKLQTREMQLIEEAMKTFEETKLQSEDFKKQLTEDLKNLETDFNSAVEMLNNTEEIHGNILKVINTIKKAENIPCYLKLPESNEAPFRFLPSEDIVKHIGRLGRIELDEKHKHLISSLGEFPEAITEEDLESSKDITLSFQSFSYPKAFDKEPEPKPCEKQALRRPHLLQRSISGQVEQVLVTHLKNPSDFMVQKCSNIQKLKSLMKQIENWCLAASGIKDNMLLDVKLDDFVFAQYSLDNNWYRARVKRVETVIDDVQKAYVKVVEVFYVDYGNSEILHINKLLLPPVKFFKEPEYAIKCCLSNITSVSQDDVWSAEAIKVFATIVHSKILTMTVLKEQHGVWYCNLCTPPNNHIRDDIPTSLQDALVFLGFAKYEASETSLLHKDATSRDYPSAERRFVSETLEVMVTHAENPLHFYIQKMGIEYQYLAVSMEDMQTIYQADTKDLWVIYCPVKDLVCACQCPSDNMWYRAKVIDAPGEQMVNVCYVDYGNTEIVSYRNLRKLLDKFIMLPIQAKLCKLAYVEPLDSKEDWTMGTNWLVENFLLKECLIEVVAVHDSYTEVVLQHTESNLIVNEAIVELGYAKKSATAPDKIPPIYLRSCESPSINGSLSPEPSVEKNNNLSSINPVQPPGDQKSPPITLSESQIEVTISVFRSLSEFYLHTVENHTKLTSLMESLEEYYNNSEAEPGVTGTIGGDYAIYYPVEDKPFSWYRARVHDILHSNLIQVFFVDFGNTEIVQVSNIRMLATNFMVNSSYAMKCHLSGYIPAGDKKEWSQTACEFAIEELKGKRYYVVKKEEIVNGSLPVDLLIENFTAETALEPASRDYYSLGKKLQENGLAIPTRKLQTNSSPSVTSNSEDVKCLKRPPDIHFKDCPLPSDNVIYVVPTYIDDDGTIFAHECHKDETSPLEELNKLLYAHYPNCLTQHIEPICWEIGDSCLCFYEAEKVWARATILAVQELIKVRYIDYGNHDMVSLNKLRPDIEPVAHLPPLCLHIKLHGIVPVSGKWTSNILDVMHNIIVGKLCGIQQMSSKENGTCEVRLIDPDGQELGELLCDKKYTYQKYSLTFLEEQSEKIAHMLQTCNPFKNMKFTFNKSIPVLVTHVELPNVIYFQNSQRSSSDEESRRINSQLLQLEEMSVELNEYALSAPPIKKTVVGKACCCQFTVDDCWYRSVIADVKQTDMLVLYVDYGTSEYIDKSRIREISQKFLKLPSQAVRCVVKGMKPSDESHQWTEEAMKAVIDSVVNKELDAVLQKTQRPWLEVQLYDPAAESALAYQSVIDSELVSCERDSP